ncbi:MAG: hypothetical protein ACI9N9_000036 [Enterobacterales bacterium]|jgi:hypothetical protein
MSEKTAMQELEIFVTDVVNGKYQALTDSQEIKDATESLKGIFKQQTSKAYETAIHDTINFDIDKDNAEEVLHYSNKYINETYGL